MGAALVVVAAACLGARVMWVHDTFGEWGVSPASPPLRISTLGRDYERSELSPLTEAPPGFRQVDTTDRGTVFSPIEAPKPSPVVVYLQDDEGRVWSYALVGGP
ncbi:hypothetical protein ASG76_14965 [Nocardioides sp. Soil774]|nr:hypothetical protein ASG76_14965 [Nocardioides sp. Soil774]